MVTMVKMRMIFWAGCFLPFLAWAGEAETLFEQANQAYAGGDYGKALELYEAVSGMGYESAALYFNMGNAAYKQVQLGRAILNYERAARLNPSDEDIAFNLKLANMRLVDKVEAAPEFLVSRWWNNLLNGRASGSWALWALTCLWLALLAGAAFLYLRRSIFRRFTFFGGIFLLLASLFCLGSALRKYDLEQNSRQAIVMASNAYVKSAPDRQSTDLFIIHEGLKVTVLDETGTWKRVRLGDGKSGWMETREIEEI